MLRALLYRRPPLAAFHLGQRYHSLHEPYRHLGYPPSPPPRGPPQSPPLGRGRRGKPARVGSAAGSAAAAAVGKSEWWAMDGEMHEIGEHVPRRERFVLPRDNLPNKRRKQMREQFMRRTRLVLKDNEHEPWCRKYMELYQELRENWERLYWDEGYSKKIAEDHANYESAEDDDLDFSPYRRRQQNSEFDKEQTTGANETWQRVSQVRDKFEYDRERRMSDRAFGPMSMRSNFNAQNTSSRMDRMRPRSPSLAFEDRE